MTNENEKKSDEAQAFTLLSQGTKDLSFENITPLSQQVMNADEQPQIDVKLKVEVNKSDIEGVFKINLVTNIQAKLKVDLFVLSLDYSGEFMVKGFPDDLMEPLLYIECPRLLFPFARSIIAHVVGDGGFPPLYLSPVNFIDIYEQQRKPSDTQHIVQ